MNRSVLRYFGGKRLLSSRILPYIPKNYKHFRSVFLGGGGLEFNLNPLGVSEVWNDLDSNLINFYSVLQNPETYKSFCFLCELTPFSEEAYTKASFLSSLPIENFGDSVLLAYSFFISNRMSRGGDGKSFATPTKRLRREINENVSAWLGVVENLPEFHNRIKYVEIRKMDFRDFIEKYDTEESFFYLDPPYLPCTRKAGGYDVEMSESDHEDLLKIISRMKGRFLIHGYPSDLYETFSQENGWSSVELPTKKHSSSQKEKPDAIEKFWVNYDLETGK
jgi:DNA adenine methylase